MSTPPPIPEHSFSDSEDPSAAVGQEAATDARRVRRTASHLSKRRPLLIDLFHPAPKHEAPELQAGSNGGQSSTDGGTVVHGVPSERSLYMGSATSTGHGHRAPSRKGAMANVFGDALLDRPSTAVNLPADAAKTYLEMAREDLEKSDAPSSAAATWVIHPIRTKWYRWWYLVTVVAACFTGWLTPFRLAYLPNTGYADLRYSWLTVGDFLVLLIFVFDICISFFVAHYDRMGRLVTEPRLIAVHYAQGRLVADLITTIPWDAIAVSVTHHDPDSLEGRYLGLLALLKLGRLYRLVLLFRQMTYDLEHSLLVTTFLRNGCFTFFSLHWAACAFYFIARQSGFSDTTWVGQEQSLLSGRSTFERYLYSFYWAIVTFNTLGYGDLHPYSTAEVVFTIFYISSNMVLWAYILSTMSLLVVKDDEVTGRYRARMSNLLQYCTSNRLPPDVTDQMKSLLRYNMSLRLDAVSDEAVLAAFPTTVRRHILRALYRGPLSACYLFRATGEKFLDALLMSARVELYKPQVELISAMDHVNELYIIVGGHVEITADAALLTAGPSGQLDPNKRLPRSITSASIPEGIAMGAMGGRDGSRRGVRGWWGRVRGRPASSDGQSGSEADLQAALAAEDAAGEAGDALLRQVLAPGDAFAEVSYFTEVPKPEAVRALTATRVLVINRSAYNAVSGDFPISARQVLDNLQRRAEELVAQHVPAELVRSLQRHTGRYTPSPSTSRGAPAGSKASPPGGGDFFPPPPKSFSGTKEGIAGRKTRLGRSSAAPGVNGGISLTSADSGSEGHDADPAPLGRTGRRLTGGSRMLLSTLSMPMVRTNLARAMEGIAARSVSDVSEEEPLAGGGLSLAQTRMVEELMRLRQLVRKAVAKMDLSRTEALLHAAAADDVDTVTSLLSQGMSVDTADYDGRTPLMISAGKGSKEVLLALLWRGANLRLKDMRGQSALLAAVVGGHREVVDLLIAQGARLEMEPLMLAAMMCKLVYEGDMPQLRLLIRAGASPNVQDYDQQTPLHIAAADANLPAVKVLVEEGHADLTIRDRWRRNPLDMAFKVFAVTVADYLAARMTPEEAGRSRTWAAQDRTDHMLTAAQWGDTDAITTLLRRGISPDCADYDNSTALFVATVNGQEAVVTLLLEHGADPNRLNSFGSSPLLEAALGGRDTLLDILLEAGARLCQDPVDQAVLLAGLVHQRRHDTLARLLRSGADPGAADYDGHTALHVAAAMGDLMALRLFADMASSGAIPGVAGVDWGVTDRWGETPLTEAQRAGAAPEVQDFIRQQLSPGTSSSAMGTQPFGSPGSGAGRLPLRTGGGGLGRTGSGVTGLARTGSGMSGLHRTGSSASAMPRSSSGGSSGGAPGGRVRYMFLGARSRLAPSQEEGAASDLQQAGLGSSSSTPRAMREGATAVLGGAEGSGAQAADAGAGAAADGAGPSAGTSS